MTDINSDINSDTNSVLNKETKEQLDQLEFKVAFQEDTIEQLNLVVTTQQRTIDTLQQNQQIIIEKLKGLQNSSSNINAGEEIPPHY